MKKTAFEETYAKLNAEQKRAVDTIEGPVMVVAGPGTGKTQILTLRIANILDKSDVQPENIMALTFTNSGVHSMRKRLHELIGDTAYRVNIFTFHAFSEHLIKEFPLYFPQFEYAKVIDDLEKVTIIERILSEGTFEKLISFHDDYMHVTSIKRAIDTIKQEGYSPEQFKGLIPQWKDALLSDENVYYKRKYGAFQVGDIKPSEQLKIENKVGKAEEIAVLYEKYQEEIVEAGRYDFSDMVLSVLRVLRENQDFKYDIQEKYQYILVDEHQDTNVGQNELIEHLTDAEHLGGHPNIFTVGDEKQSIYRFQGASEETFDHFNSIFNDIEIITLKNNYRSTQNILSGSHALITHTMPNAAELVSHSKGNDLIQIAGFSNYKMELIFVANSIKERIESGIDPEEIAIIFRSNKHVEDIKSILGHKNIPFTVFAKSSVFDATDIRNIITLLRVVNNPHDDEYVSKALFINFIGLDAYDVVRVLQAKRKREYRDTKIFEIIASQTILKELGVKNPQQFIAFSGIIKESIVATHNVSFVDFLKEFLTNTGYITFMLQSEVSQDKLMVIDKFFNEVKKQSTNKKGEYSLEDCLAMIDAYHAYRIDIENKNPETNDGVQLMTAHGSKGKEFRFVYIINAIRSQWEKSRGFGGISVPIKSYEGTIDDERRLFYVAMTRAKEALTISYSLTDWEGREQEKSQFIEEIPEHFVEYIATTHTRAEYGDDLQSFIMPYAHKATVFDPEFIEALFFEQGLNLTALNNYLECPLKYFYRNMVRIPSAYSPFLAYGNAMHQALEKFFILSKKKEVIAGKEVLTDYFTRAIEESDMNARDREKYLKKGLDSLDDYYVMYSKDWTVRVAIEQFVARDIELEKDTQLRLTGKIDKIEYPGSELDGPIAIVDYKTGKSFSEKNKTNKESLKRQIIFYHLLLENFRGGSHHIEKATLDFIEKNSKGLFEQYSVNVDDEDRRELVDIITTMKNSVISGAFLNKGCSKKDCEWCELHARIQAQ